MPAALLVLQTFIAGSEHHAFRMDVSTLRKGTPLTMVREPHNRYDTNAIRFDSPAGAKLGYVPAPTALWMAKLLDAGVPLHAEFVELTFAPRNIIVNVFVQVQERDL